MGKRPTVMNLIHKDDEDDDEDHSTLTIKEERGTQKMLVMARPKAVIMWL
jgi:hypothetical protein